MKTNNEFHPNGQLAYTETILELSGKDTSLYPNSSRRKDGSEWIRVGRNSKYHDNGQLAWELNYDEKGNLIKDDSKEFRKDGTRIIY